MDWEKVAYALVGFLGGLLASLLKAFYPPYSDLFNQNIQLRSRVAELEEDLRDTLDDEKV